MGQAAALMHDRMPNFKDMTIPRKVFERTDITPYAKLVYGVLASFKNGLPWRIAEIGGLCGIPPRQVSTACKVLEEKGLLRRSTKNDKRWKRKLPDKYYVIPPKEDEGFGVPQFLSNDISKVQTELKEMFYGLEAE